MAAKLQRVVGHRKTNAGSTAMPNQKDLESFLASYPPEVGALARAAKRLLEASLPDAEETLNESAKVIGYGYGPGYKGCVCTLILSRAGVKLGIPYGAAMPDPNGLMRGAGKVHRHVVLQTLDDLKQPGLKALLKGTLAAWKERTKANN
jgi:hypothetical protein